MTPQESRDSLELAVLFKGDADAVGRQAIIRAFEQMLTLYIFELLSEDVSPEKALHVRAKAMGLLDTLTQMGVSITHAMESVPVKEGVRRRVRSLLTT